MTKTKELEAEVERLKKQVEHYKAVVDELERQLYSIEQGE